MYSQSGFHLRIIALTLSLAGLGAQAQTTLFVEPPATTTFPVVFEHTLDASKAKTGDPVLAKTTEAVFLPDGVLPKGTIVSGHVVESSAFRFDPTPYAKQRPSYISIHFDKAIMDNRSIPLHVTMRALANRNAAYEASRPQTFGNDTDHLGTMVQIGGEQYSPIGKQLMSPDDEDIVGYIHKQGVVAHLIPREFVSPYSTFHCDGSITEQAVGIFSADACGAYGFATVSISQDGTDNILLEAPHSTIKLYGGSAALLEEVATR